MTTSPVPDVAARARLSLGRADADVHRVVATLLTARGASGTIADIGCGTGGLWHTAGAAFTRYIGVDVVRYDGLSERVEFRPADLERDGIPLDEGSVDVAAAVEVIEHVDNPRALFRDLVRVTRPGGWVVVTTPNQLSVLSLLSLVVKGHFAAFQDGEYPAHRSALLEKDLRRMATECGLTGVEVAYTRRGRVPLTPWHYPRALAAMSPRRLSDNVALIGRR